MNDPVSVDNQDSSTAAMGKCTRCGLSVTHEQIDQGRAITRDDQLLCPDCVEQLRAIRKQRRSHPDTHGHLENMAGEIQNLVRLLGTERFSIWNILGGLAQAGALACVAVALFNLTSQTPLLWGILMQLMALTFFTAARK